MTDATSLTAAACILLGQLENLVQQLTDEAYTAPVARLHGATIGQHLRHTLEFFICFENGVAAGTVNYDHRTRSQALETQRAVALKTIAAVQAFLDTPPPAKPLLLEVSYAEHSEAPVGMPTNFCRELVYNIEHAVHHMALIKIGLGELVPHLDLPRGFGVAVSTLRHQTRPTVAP